jgi:hypothetical protein
VTAGDLVYIRANYFTLDELCAGRAERPADVRRLIAERLLPAPSYVLDDGTEMFPADYFVLVDDAGGHGRLRTEFERRYLDSGGSHEELEQDWRGYIEGVYAVCLRCVSPEGIVRKETLVRSLSGLLAAPRHDDPTWAAQVRREVWELDALEREFAPDYDRGGRFGKPPTRDLLIRQAHDRYPDLFDPPVAV